MDTAENTKTLKSRIIMYTYISLTVTKPEFSHNEPIYFLLSEALIFFIRSGLTRSFPNSTLFLELQ
jgi:hypothetical protein